MKTKFREARGYILATIACAILTALSFMVVTTGVDKQIGVWLLFISAMLQVLIQGRYFLHLDHSTQAREDLQLILFSTALMLIMILGTIWVLGDLSGRMMHA